MTDYFGAYLGFDKPDTIPIRFAPGLISTEDNDDFIIAISNDGTQIVFSRTDIGLKNWAKSWRMLYMRQINGRWTLPEELSFPEGKFGVNPAFSDRGDKIFFSIVESGTNSYGYIHIGDSTYSDLISIGNPFGTSSKCFSYFMDVDSTFYFCGKMKDFVGGNTDLYCSYKNENGWVVRNIAELNNENDNDSPFISPKGDYMVYNQAFFPNTMDSSIVMLSFRGENNSWEEPINLTGKMGGLKNNWKPIITSDGKYLFLSMQNEDGFDIYWVSTEVIDKLR